MKQLLLLPALLLGAWAGSGPAAPPVARSRSGLKYQYWQTNPRRWRGTIGKLPVTLQLDSGYLGGYSGEYSYDRLGRGLSLWQDEQTTKPGQLPAFEERTWEPTFGVTGWLQLSGPVGRRISGSWRSPDGRRSAPLALREDYTDAARYEQHTWSVQVPDAPDGRGIGDSLSCELSYLWVRLPGNPAAEQRLRRALGPPVALAAMPAHLDSLLQGQAEGYYHRDELFVTCNTNYLLSVAGWHRDSNDEELTFCGWGEHRNFDLRTGRELHLADLLRPGYAAPLRRLLLKKLAVEWQNPHYDGIGADGQLPKGGFGISPTGLTFSYDQRDEESLGFPGPYHADTEVGVELSYRELLPLIRPDGPLAAMLRERGLTATGAAAATPAAKPSK